MQEEVTHRTVALYVSAGKLTARTLAKALSGASRKIKQGQKNAQTPQGRQPVKKLMNHGVATNTIPLDGDTRLFDRVARKWNVDLSPVRELVSLQRRCANNINQVAIHANTCGVDQAEITALQRDYTELWGRVSDVLKQLAAVVEM